MAAKMFEFRAFKRSGMGWSLVGEIGFRASTVLVGIEVAQIKVGGTCIYSVFSLVSS